MFILSFYINEIESWAIECRVSDFLKQLYQFSLSPPSPPSSYTQALLSTEYTRPKITSTQLRLFTGTVHCKLVDYLQMRNFAHATGQPL